MSWLFGYVGAVTPARRAELQSLHEAPHYGSAGGNHYVQSGGLRATCHGGPAPDGKAQWMVTGLGLDPARHAALDHRGWRDVLSDPDPALTALDGHFVAAVIGDGAVQLFTDQLGTRTLHYGRYADGWAFSTRIDWLAKLHRGLDIDYEAFGSHWLAFNQLSTRSQILGLARLGPGGRLTLRGTTCRAVERAWSCDVTETDTAGGTFAQALEGYCTPQAQISLGLSGGLDSRLLLALGARQTHVFGPPDHPDVAMAQRIARRLHLDQRHIQDSDWDGDQALEMLRTRSRITHLISAASSVLDMRYYSHLRRDGLTVIDGGFGEVARRQFMNRMLRSGRPWNDPAQVLPLISVARAPVFCREALAAMTRGALGDIEQHRALFHAGLNRANAADLLGVRARLPNFFGLEQNRLDAMAACYMPFAQPSVLRALFQVPLVLRRNGRLFKRLIRARLPTLGRLPLVKGTTTYPFFLPTLGAHVTSMIKKKVGLTYSDPRPHQYLQAARPWVQDLVRSIEVRTYAAYDIRQVQNLVDGYYGGQQSLAGSVDWWLAFEMWRRVVHAAD